MSQPLETPMVSVVMPAWNAAAYIREAVDSVLSQSFADLELLVINDGSEDWDYQQLALIDSRVRVIDCERGGVSKARNTGMRLSRGRYIAFIDADDIWVPGKLQSQVEYLESHPEHAITFGEVRRWYPDASGQYPDITPLFPTEEQLRVKEERLSGWIYTKILMGSTLGMITPLMRREVYEKVGEFDVSMSRGEDYEFWLRCSRQFTMQGFRVVMAIYRMHHQSAMHRVVENNQLVELLSSARERWGLAEPDGTPLSVWAFRRRLGVAHFDHGYVHYWSGDAGIALHAFSHSLLYGHLMIRSAVYCVFSALKLGFRQIVPQSRSPADHA